MIRDGLFLAEPSVRQLDFVEIDCTAVQLIERKVNRRDAINVQAAGSEKVERNADCLHHDLITTAHLVIWIKIGI